MVNRENLSSGTSDFSKPLQPRIDVHIHLAGNGCCQSGCWISPRFQKRYTFRLIKKILGITPQQFENTVDRDWAQRVADMIASSPSLDYGVVLGFDGVYHHTTGELIADQSQMIIPLEWVFKICRSHPGLLPGPSINPHDRSALEKLERCIEEGAVLIKWLPSAQGIDLGRSELKPFFTKMAQAKMPLLVHIGGERTFYEVSPGANDIKKLRGALEMGVPIICAHSATPILFSKEEDQRPTLRSMLEEYPHLYIDNSGLLNPSRFAHAPELIKDPLLQQRTLYGSDWPVPSHSYYFPRKLGLKNIKALESIANPLEKDIQIKTRLGYEPEMLTRAAGVLAHLEKWVGKVK